MQMSAAYVVPWWIVCVGVAIVFLVALKVARVWILHRLRSNTPGPSPSPPTLSRQPGSTSARAKSRAMPYSLPTTAFGKTAGTYPDKTDVAPKGKQSATG